MNNFKILKCMYIHGKCNLFYKYSTCALIFLLPLKSRLCVYEYLVCFSVIVSYVSDLFLFY